MVARSPAIERRSDDNGKRPNGCQYLDSRVRRLPTPVSPGNLLVERSCCQSSFALHTRGDALLSMGQVARAAGAASEPAIGSRSPPWGCGNDESAALLNESAHRPRASIRHSHHQLRPYAGRVHIAGTLGHSRVPVVQLKVTLLTSMAIETDSSWGVPSGLRT
jgi:hypothetical protein